MKKIQIVSFIFLLLFFSGCLVRSIHPFFTDEDIVFDEAILGQWYDEDSLSWQISRYEHIGGFLDNSAESDDSYRLEFIDDEGRKNIFNAHLFRLGDSLYFDFCPLFEDGLEDSFYSYHLVPSHSLARLSFLSDKKMIIKWFHEEWLRELLSEDRVKIKHEVFSRNPLLQTESYLLTASTEDLQKFILKYADHPEAFDADGKPLNEDGRDENVLEVVLTRE